MKKEEEKKGQAAPPKKVKETYKKVRMLGEGAYGKVFLVTCGSDGQQAAIKQLETKDMDMEEQLIVKKEILLMEAMHHPNIVALRESYDTKGGRKNIVMEVADGPDLEEEQKDKKFVSKCQGIPLQHFSETEVLDWFTQTCVALKYVHERRILHRDLKPQNIFKTKSGIIKLGDFGVSSVLQNTCGKASTEIGTPLYISPEIVRGEKYDASTDVWSLGVTFYEIMALKRAFDTNVDIDDLNEKIKKGDVDPLPDMYSKDFQKIIKSMLTVDPKKRPTIKQILKDPLIISRLRILIVSKEYKDQFARGLRIHENYFKEYQKPHTDEGAPEDVVKKIKDYDEKLAGLNHGDWKPPNDIDIKVFYAAYESFIKSINPSRNYYKT